MNQSNYSYREYNDTYVLYDSDEEEDRSMMEIILASDTYEKIKNCNNKYIYITIFYILNYFSITENFFK